LLLVREGVSSPCAAAGLSGPDRHPSPRGYTSWLAGGGIKGGVSHGSTGELGYRAEQNKHHYSDLHATILSQLGLDYQKTTLNGFERTMRLMEEGFGPIKEIIA
jgi:hypothetical protein